jgi:glyoxylase-like metal-dependent hydrolase (beta-lactamase superfamily II)
MFDVGMCPPGALKFGTILVSHGHADHLGGLPYLVSQHGLMSSPPPVHVHMPAEVVAAHAADPRPVVADRGV